MDRLILLLRPAVSFLDGVRTVNWDLRSCLEGSQSAQPFLSQVSKPQRKLQRMRSGDSTTLVKHLQESVRVAQTRASVPPGACVQRAQESIDSACEQKILYEGRKGLPNSRPRQQLSITPSCCSASLTASGTDRCFFWSPGSFGVGEPTQLRVAQ